MVVGHKKKSRLPAAVAVAAMGAGTAAIAADTVPPEIPKCDKKIGTLAVKEPEHNWWADLQLESPEALIKVFVTSPSASRWSIAARAWRRPRPSGSWQAAASCGADPTSARAR